MAQMEARQPMEEQDVVKLKKTALTATDANGNRIPLEGQPPAVVATLRACGWEIR